MPQLSDLVEKRKFVKKEYRPWDLTGTGTVDGKEACKSPLDTAVKTPPATPSQPVMQATFPPISAPTPKTDNETGNKTGNVSGNKQVTNRKQPGNKQVTKTKQRGNNEITTREQPGNELDNVTGNTEKLAFLVESIKKLAGIQKNIFFYVINVCAARGTLETGNLLSSDLAMAANCSIGSAKTSLIRLIEKALIMRLQGKASRGGHMQLGITKEIQAASIQAQRVLFNPFKISRIDNITGNELGNTGYSSSSIYKNTTTTTVLPDEWKKIHFDNLQPIGFSETQLQQLYESPMTTPEIVQDAIHRFAYSLTHSDKVRAYTDPLNVLMGVLRKGQRWNEPNYLSPKELALRELLAEKRAQKEKRDAMLKELLELEFPEWKKKLTEAEIKDIVPADVLRMNVFAAKEAALRSYFLDHMLTPRFLEEKK